MKKILWNPMGVKHAMKIHSRRFPIRMGAACYKTDAEIAEEEKKKKEQAEKDVLTKDGLLKHLEIMKADLEAKLKDDANKTIAETLKEKLEAVDAMKETVDKLAADTTTAEALKVLQADMATTIKAFDLLQTRMKGIHLDQPRMVKTISEAMVEKMMEAGKIDANGEYKSEAIEQALRSAGGSFTLKLGHVSLKAQGADMTQANSLTGDPMATYNQRQALIPAQKVNFRDLVSTVQSPTGLYVTYSENAGGTNNITTQTEGATKGQNEYDLTEIKTVAKYIAGFAVITKQLLKNLPFIQNALTRMLLRDFYKAENAYFYSTAVSAATGGTIGGTSPDDILQLIALIGAQLDTNYNVSFVVVSNTLMARLISGTYSKGYYPGAGSVVLNDSRGLTLFGVPVVAASWVTANYALLIDSDYMERVEVEGLNVTFSFEDSVNFRQNKVTVKAECFEELNPMVGASIISMNLGAS